jgi:hypothetical protein
MENQTKTVEQLRAVQVEIAQFAESMKNQIERGMRPERIMADLQELEWIIEAARN